MEDRFRDRSGSWEIQVWCSIDERTKNEKKEIIQEAKQIVDVKEVITSILMVSDLSRQRE